MNRPSRPAFHCHLVLVGAEGHVLAVRERGTWTLPRFVSEERIRWSSAGAIIPRARETLGTPVTLLRCLHSEQDDEGGVVSVELEAQEDGFEPLGGAAWRPLEEILGPSDQARRALADSANDGIQAPWRRRGWFTEAATWIETQLGALGRPLAAPVEQVRAWSISSVLRAPTAAGDVYFKAVPPLFAAEPPLTKQLDRRHPGRVPRVLALDRERHSLLTDDFGGTRLEDVAEGVAWDRALRTYAELQLAWTDRLDELRSLGCPDRGLDALEAEIEPALGDVYSMRTGRNPLTGEELAALPKLVPRLHAACAELRALGIPESLEHGDLHAGNIAVVDGDPLFYDWTDGCTSVPFFSLTPLFRWRLAHEPDRLLRAYLEPWCEAFGAETTERAYELSGLLGFLHHLVSYRRLIAGVDANARWEWDGVISDFARALLEADAIP